MPAPRFFRTRGCRPAGVKAAGRSATRCPGSPISMPHCGSAGFSIGDRAIAGPVTHLACLITHVSWIQTKTWR
jgi:hypothetical protein